MLLLAEVSPQTPLLLSEQCFSLPLLPGFFFFMWVGTRKAQHTCQDNLQVEATSLEHVGSSNGTQVSRLMWLGPLCAEPSCSLP